MSIPIDKLHDFEYGAGFKATVEKALAKHDTAIEPLSSKAREEPHSLKSGVFSGSAGAIAAVPAHAALSTDFPAATTPAHQKEVASTPIPGELSIVHDSSCQGAITSSNLNTGIAANIETGPVLPSSVTLTREGKKFTYSSSSATVQQCIRFNGETIILGGGKAHVVNLRAISSSSIVPDKLCSIVITYE